MKKFRRFKQVSTFLCWAGLCAVLFQLLWLLSRLIDQGIRAILAPFPVDYGEGPLVEHALRLAQGLAIYNYPIIDPPYQVVNYPPLFIAVQAPLMYFWGASLAYGRSISLLCTLAAGVFVGLTTAHLTHRRWLGLVCALLLLSFPCVFHWSALNRVDMLALALSWAGIWIILKGKCDRHSLILGGFLLAAAIYTRQSYMLAAPLAAFIFTWRQVNFRRALRLAGWVFGLCAAAFLILQRMTGGGFLFHIVTANVNPLRIAWLIRAVVDAMRSYPLLLAAGGVVMVVGLRRCIQSINISFRKNLDRDKPLADDLFSDSIWLVFPYLAGGFASALTIAKDGSNVNYLLEFSAALCLCAGVCLKWGLDVADHAFKRDRISIGIFIPAVMLILLALQVRLLWWWGDRDLYQRIANRLQPAAEMAVLSQMVRSAPGAVLADEMMGLLPLNGKSIVIQPFEMRMLCEAGLWDDQAMVQAIDRREFSLLILYEPEYWDAPRQRWTKGILSSIYRNYTRSETLARMGIYRPDP